MLAKPWKKSKRLRIPVRYFSTGWHCTRLAGLQAGESIVIYGAGPVCLMAALSAMIQGANKVMVVDRYPDRLALAGKIGCIPIDDSKASPVDQVLEQTRGEGADRGCATSLTAARYPISP
jgi:glutathione-independent formaldehyde dehydrogenase